MFSSTKMVIFLILILLEYNKLFNKGLGDLVCLNSPKALPCTTSTQWEYKAFEPVEGEALTAAGTEEWGA